MKLSAWTFALGMLGVPAIVGLFALGCGATPRAEPPLSVAPPPTAVVPAPNAPELGAPRRLSAALAACVDGPPTPEARCTAASPADCREECRELDFTSCHRFAVAAPSAWCRRSLLVAACDAEVAAACVDLAHDPTHEVTHGSADDVAHSARAKSFELLGRACELASGRGCREFAERVEDTNDAGANAGANGEANASANASANA
ncbi:MAG: hypothetical protein EXR75_16025, partial [Myxococcales bacterium]|nr:hypothetical protein [Myxococcales bacterium]